MLRIHRKTRLAVVLPASVAFIALAAASAANAQSAGTSDLKGFWLTTPYPELALAPGDNESISLTLKNADLPPQRAEINVTGIPDGWTWSLEGGGRAVTAAMVDPNDTQRLTLKVTAPKDAVDKSFPITVEAKTASETISLPMTVRVSEKAAGGVKVTPQLPALRGTAKSKFTYKVKVENDSSEDALFNLAAKAPDGFQTHFKQGYGSEEITGLPVKAGASEDLTVEVDPPSSVAAGRYPIELALGDGKTGASADLSLEVTGQAELKLVGDQGRLSGAAVAGKDSSFNFTVANTGSAPLDGISFDSTPPQGWKVTYSPDSIPALAPNAKQDVSVTIHPSEKAIAGDYMIGLNAKSGNATDNEQFRVTVETSTVWGVAGIGVIAAALLVLGMGIMRYGRR